jgi:hypothetical protein
MVNTNQEFEFELPVGFEPNVEAPAPVGNPPAEQKPEGVVIPDIPNPVPPVDNPVDNTGIPATEQGDDIFGELLKGADPATPEGTSSDDPFSFFATELELALPEGVEKWDKEAVAKAARARLDNARQQLNLDDYDPEIKLLFEHVQEHGGSIVGLNLDPVIKGLNELTLYDPEYFYRVNMARMLDAQGGLDEDEIMNIVETKISKIPEDQRDSFFSEYHKDKIKTEINPGIENRLREINKEKQSYRDRLKLASDAEQGRVVESMIKSAEKLTDFVGVKLSQAHKEAIVSKIKTGQVAKEISKDPGTYQLMGYLAVTMGPQAANAYRDIIKNGSQSRYKAGVESTLDQFYGSSGKSRSDGQGSVPDPDNVVLNDWDVLNSIIKR